MIVRTGEITQGQSIFLGRLAEKIDSRHAARPGHVLDNHCGIAGNVFGQVARDDSSFDIRGSAGGEIYEKDNVLSLIERRLPGKRRSKRQEYAEKKQ